MSRKKTGDPSLSALVREVRACRICEQDLPLGPRPVLRATRTARLLLVGQAPGVRVHETGIPWNDPSGDRLRAWLDVSREIFYDDARIALFPWGFATLVGMRAAATCLHAPNVPGHGFLACSNACRTSS